MTELRHRGRSHGGSSASVHASPALQRLGRGAAPRIEVRCVDCGYGGVVTRLPERCPMCGGTVWRERARRNGRWESTRRFA